jgi:hypothetical protein
VFLQVHGVARDEARASEVHVESVSFLGWTVQCAAREFHRRRQAHGIRCANASCPTLDAAQERWKTIAEERARRPEIGIGPNSAPREERHELRIAEGGRAMIAKAPRWMLVAAECGRR